MKALANTGSGITVYDGASNNTIGGAAQGAGNVISGNLGEGIYIVGAGVLNNLVQGNLIGIGADATTPVGNKLSGVFDDDASGTTIGERHRYAGNTIGPTPATASTSRAPA